MALDTVTTQFIQRGVGGLRSDLRAIGADMDTLEGKAERMSRVSDRLLGFGAAGAGAMALIGGASLKAYGEMQMIEIGFSKSLGGMDKAKAKIKELAEFDRQSPFSFQESVQGAMRLRAAGFEADRLKSVMTDIGDASAGTGGGTDEFMGIVRALGQMRSKGRISMEEINQLADRNVNALAILQKQLKLTDEQKAKLMEGTYTIDSEAGVDALLKGFRELYGGAMVEASKTLPGQVSNLQSAVQQLGVALGEVISKGGGIGASIGSLTSFADATTEFVKNNPELVKTVAAIAGIGTAGALAAGAVGKVAGIFNEVSAAKDKLTGATKRDDAAEKTKTLTAIKESGALHGTGDAALSAADAKEKLAGATEKEARLAKARAQIENSLSKAQAKRAGVADGTPEAKRLDKQIKNLREERKRIRDAQDEPGGGGSRGFNGVGGTAGAAAMAALTGDTQGAVDAVKSQFEELAQAKLDAFMDDPKQAIKDFKAEGIAAVAGVKTLLSRPLLMPNATQGPLGALGARLGMRAGVINQVNGGGAISGGLAAGSAALGIGAGLGAREDYSKLGYSAGQSAALGATTGFGVGAAAMFVPGGLVAAAIAETVRFDITKLWIEPMEDRAENGNGLEPQQEKKQRTQTRQQNADDYFALAEKKEKEANGIDTTLDFAGDDRARQAELRREAETFRRQGQMQQKIGRQEAAAQKLINPHQTIGYDSDQYKSARAMSEAAGTGRAEYDERRGMALAAANGQSYQTKEQRAAAAWQQESNGDAYAMQPTGAPQMVGAPVATRHNNGATTIQFPPLRLPESPGDRSARKLAYSNRTASPNFAY